jgi:hypothetical protein
MPLPEPGPHDDGLNMSLVRSDETLQYEPPVGRPAALGFRADVSLLRRIRSVARRG